MSEDELATKRAAATRYTKQWRLHKLRTGEPMSVPIWRFQRRLQALQALGWSKVVIAEHAGIVPQALYESDKHAAFVTRRRFDQIDATYRALSMRLPPTDTTGQAVSVGKVLASARRNGWLPPLAWEDIDDPDERPDMSQGALTTAERLAELEWLIGAGVPEEQALQQLGWSRSAMERARERMNKEEVA